MDRAARRYARRVLILHLALFAGVLLIMALTARVLYTGAREQAIGQARQTQEMLARQTALSIKNYYDSITGVLDLLHAGPNEPAEAPTRRALVEQGVFARMAPSVWQSIKERTSLLFVLDSRDSTTWAKVIGADPGAPTPQQVVEHTSAWLGQVKGPTVSPYLEFDPAHGDAAPDHASGRDGAHVVAVPLRGPEGLLMVAVVPIAKLERALLSDVNNRPTTGAMLVDETGVILSHSRPQVVGKNVLTDVEDPRTRKLARHYIEAGGAGTEIFEHAEVIGGERMEAAMSTIQPVEVLGRRWTLVISSALSDVDAVITPVFRDAMLWAALIMLALTLILTSTAIQSIRSRVRMERMRHDLLTKELTQAREIQLAWLPKNDDDPPHLDLSAINEPATHISGDFYNWFQLCDGRTVVLIGDVTGHGMAAAFLMATTQLLVRTTMPRCGAAGECLQEANRQLCMQAFNGQFVTMLLLVIDVRRGTVEVATAGHPPPLVGDGGKFEPLAVEPQLVLGIDPGAEYITQRFELARGAALVLYTDGVIDAQDPDGNRFSVEGLANALYGRYEHAQAIVDTVVRAVDEFRGERDLPDDLTLVAVQLQEAPAHAQPALAKGAAC